jgi:hypothetical protein
MTFNTGYAQRTITPSLERPVYLAGFGRNRTAVDVHDDLYARALAMESETTRLVLVALDLIGLPRRMCREVENRVNNYLAGHGQPASWRILIASTHTHHAPDTLGLWGPDEATSGVDPLYIDWLLSQISSAVLDAIQQLRPSSLRASAVPVPGLVKNARDPEIVDDELTCLQFLGEGSDLYATLLIYPCHPEVLWEHNPQITSDYPGELRRMVESTGNTPCIFFVGALGGMLTPDVTDHSFPEAEAMGWTLAQAALFSLASPDILEISAPVLSVQTLPVNIPLENPIFHLAISAGLLPDERSQSGELITQVSLIKIGPVWLACVPGELLPKLGLEVKERLCQTGARLAAIVGLADDEIGYILPQEDYVYPPDPFDPGEHYEETMSLGPEAGPRLLQAIYSLI